MAKSRKPKGTPIKDDAGNPLSLAVKPIVSGFVITCPKCKDHKQHKVSEFAPSIEIGPFKCQACEFEYVFTPPIRVGGTKRRYVV